MIVRNVTVALLCTVVIGCGRNTVAKKGDPVDPNNTSNNTTSNNTTTNNTTNNGTTNTNNGSTGTNNVPEPVCGNGALETGEGCDDGNLLDGDGCGADCTLESCGDGQLDPGEACDDGNMVDGDGCNARCTSNETCGNGVVDPGEVCDDGNLQSGDGCAADCRSNETCGNGIVDSGEACDDGNNQSGDGCQPTCRFPACGDGFLDGGEVCDDGNTSNGDGCNAQCSSAEICGNGILDVAEECDDGNQTSNDGCSSTCRVDCSVGLDRCDMMCVDTTSNADYCGDCFTACGASEICTNSTCTPVQTGSCVVAANAFPVNLQTNLGYGNIAFDNDCDIVVANDRAVHIVDAQLGSTTTTNLFNSDLMGVVQHPNGDYYALEEPGTIYRFTPSQAESTLANIGADAQAIAVAPQNFGSVGGALVVARGTRDIDLVNASSGAVNSFYTTPTGRITDIEFGPSGRLYVLLETGSVFRLNASAVRTNIGQFSASTADGLGIDPTETTLYIADSGLGQLHEMSIATGMSALVGTFTFDDGFYASGVVVDATGQVIVMTGNNSATLRVALP